MRKSIKRFCLVVLTLALILSVFAVNSIYLASAESVYIENGNLNDVVDMFGSLNFSSETIAGNYTVKERTGSNYMASVKAKNFLQFKSVKISYNLCKISVEVKSAGSSTVNLELLCDKKSAKKSGEFIIGKSWQTLDFYVCASDTTDCELKINNLSGNDVNVDNAKITETENPTVNSALSIDDGAELRVCKDSSGLRFTGRVDYDTFNEYKTNYTDVEVGILIAPKTNYFNSDKDFTIEALSSNNRKYLAIPALKTFNEGSEESDGYYGFYCAIVNLTSFTREYSARTYIKYTVGESVKYEYSAFDSTDNSRTAKYIAQCYLDSINYVDGETPIIDELNIILEFIK